jgi:hypothetical protein
MLVSPLSQSDFSADSCFSAHVISPFVAILLVCRHSFSSIPFFSSILLRNVGATDRADTHQAHDRGEAAGTFHDAAVSDPAAAHRTHHRRSCLPHVARLLRERDAPGRGRSLIARGTPSILREDAQRVFPEVPADGRDGRAARTSNTEQVFHRTRTMHEDGTIRTEMADGLTNAPPHEASGARLRAGAGPADQVSIACRGDAMARGAHLSCLQGDAPHVLAVRTRVLLASMELLAVVC